MINSNKNLAEAVQAALEKARAENRLVGAVALVLKDGRLICRETVGYADRETRTPMRADHIFRLASVTKPFTILAAAVLLEQGKLKLDAPISQWLPEFHPASADGKKPDITIRQLMSHTSGLNYAFAEGVAGGPYKKAGISDGMDDAPLTLEENITRLAAQTLLYEPGASWQYSLATDVLGYLISRVCQTSLPEAIKQLVTAPLGLTESGFSAAGPQRLVTQYRNAVPAPA